jgi:hypothetical protein
MDKRTPRAHRTAEIEDEPRPQVHVPAHLVEHLRERFPVRLSEALHPNAIANEQAEMRGQQEVIAYLQTLTK